MKEKTFNGIVSGQEEESAQNDKIVLSKNEIERIIIRYSNMVKLFEEKGENGIPYRMYYKGKTDVLLDILNDDLDA